MKHLMMVGFAVVVFAALVAPSWAVDGIIQHAKVKSVNEEKNEFVVTAPDGKEHTFALGEQSILTRDGKEVQTSDLKQGDLKVGDEICVVFDKGLVKWTVYYILNHGDKNKGQELGRGSLRSYDDAKGEMVLVDLNNKEWRASVPATSAVQLNTESGKMKDVRVGEMVTVVYDTKDSKNNLVKAIVNRKPDEKKDK